MGSSSVPQVKKKESSDSHILIFVHYLFIYLLTPGIESQSLYCMVCKNACMNLNDC